MKTGPFEITFLLVSILKMNLDVVLRRYMLAVGRHVQVHEIFLLIILPVIKLWGDIWPIYPEGRPGMSDISLLSGISGLSFDSSFLSLVFLPRPLALSVLSFFCQQSILLTFFQKTRIFFVQS